MIDISNKEEITRTASASGKIFLKEETINKIKNKTIQKGDVFTIAKVSAINAIKKVPEIIPLCHPIPINKVSLEFEIKNKNTIRVLCIVKSFARTGVEMEALMGVSSALLNIWDVVKMYEKDENGQYPSTIITDIKVEEKVKQK
ncbi:MAG: cyclic pyranopterin monophosphate synthase MoaC [Candidatus Odinarchaeota archaeon]